ncbi:D-hydantoinase [Diplocarpon rosae]|nr:D-hydantoinase [Diplocarpon rosae]
MTYEAQQLKDPEIIDVIFEARGQKMVSMIHAENGAILDSTMNKFEEKKVLDPKYHITGHPPRAMSLSYLIDVPILSVQVLLPAAARGSADARFADLRRDVSTVPLPEAEGPEKVLEVSSPLPREGEQDHGAIWQGLENGMFTVLSSDHCPFLYEDSDTGKKSLVGPKYLYGRSYISNGCPGMETRLPVALSASQLELQRCVEVTSTSPVKFYELYPRNRGILPGESAADLTIWYPEDMEEFQLANEPLYHHVNHTPYEGRTINQ